MVYHDVTADKARMQDMLSASDGCRDVPVIVDGDKVKVGYGGS